MALGSSPSPQRRRPPRSRHRIVVVDWTDRARRAVPAIRRVLREALRIHSVGNAELVVSIVTDKEMARLHRRHLGRLSPTDVLAFDMRDTRRLRERRPHSGLEGEIVVSYDAATREARRRGHAWKVELALYALHGTLHLLGYDDHSPRRAQRMHSAEDRLLKAVGFGATFAPTSKR